LANDVFTICKRKDIKLTVTWIARKYNEKADEVSKTVDYDDWFIKTKFCEFDTENWGKVTIDLFADSVNIKCDRFCSKYFCPGSFKTQMLFPLIGQENFVILYHPSI